LVHVRRSSSKSMVVNWDDPLARWSDLPAFAAPYEPYPHQLDGFCHAAWQNSIVILPTGTGKTLIAAMLIDLFSAPDAIIFFVVNNVALQEQQTNYLSRICKSPWSKVYSAQMGLRFGVTVGTAGALLGLMPVLPINTLVLAVFDEVHHATGDHPYVQLLGLIRDHCPEYPRILGLTASWLHGDLRNLEVKRHSLQSVVGATIILPAVADSFTSKAKFTKVKYPDERPELVDAQQMITLITCMTDPLHPELALAFRSQAQKAVHVETCLGTAALSVFPHAIYEIVTAQLEAKAAHAEDDWSRESTQQALQALPLARSLFDEVCSAPSVCRAPSAKARVLLELVNERRGLTLVFVEQVCCVLPMASMLADHLKETVLHVSGALSMRKETRDKHVRAFRDGQCRVLVATAAIEEGLDVPDCDCVIRFDAFSNVKSHVQGSGRARKVGSEVFYFDNSPEEEERRAAAMHGAAAGYLGALAEPASGKQPGLGEGHEWGPEETMWDSTENKSFRGQRCAACGAHLRITSRKYGKGRKKTERIYAVDGDFMCPGR